jgi:hypothetical protein
MACEHKNLRYIEVLESKYASDAEWDDDGKPYAEDGDPADLLQDKELDENYFRCQDCDARWEAVEDDIGRWVPAHFPEAL